MKTNVKWVVYKADYCTQCDIDERGDIPPEIVYGPTLFDEAMKKASELGNDYYAWPLMPE